MRLNSSTSSSHQRRRRPLSGLLNHWREHLGWPAAWGLSALALAMALLTWTWRGQPTGSPAQTVPPTTASTTGSTTPRRPPPATLSPRTRQDSVASGAAEPAPPRSLALRQAQDLDRLIVLAHRLGLATPGGLDRSELEAPPVAAETAASPAAGTQRSLRWRVELRLSGLPVALDAFVAALAQELPHARIDRIAWPTGSAASNPAQVAELSLSLRYPGPTE